MNVVGTFCAKGERTKFVTTNKSEEDAKVVLQRKLFYFGYMFDIEK